MTPPIDVSHFYMDRAPGICPSLLGWGNLPGRYPAPRVSRRSRLIFRHLHCRCIHVVIITGETPVLTSRCPLNWLSALVR